MAKTQSKNQKAGDMAVNSADLKPENAEQDTSKNEALSFQIEALKKQIELDLARIAQLEADNKEALALIVEQNAIIDRLSHKTKTGKNTVTHNGKTYQVNLKKFKLKGKEYTAESLESNSEVVEELIKINSTILIEL